MVWFARRFNSKLLFQMKKWHAKCQQYCVVGASSTLTHGMRCMHARLSMPSFNLVLDNNFWEKEIDHTANCFLNWWVTEWSPTILVELNLLIILNKIDFFNYYKGYSVLSKKKESNTEASLSWFLLGVAFKYMFLIVLKMYHAKKL